MSQPLSDRAKEPLTPAERRLLEADDRRVARFELWLLLIAASPVAALLIFVLQTLIWLRTGDWPTWPLGDALAVVGIGVVDTSWVGFNRVVAFVLSIPVSLTLLLVSPAAAAWVTRHDRRGEPEALLVARMKQAHRDEIRANLADR